MKVQDIKIYPHFLLHPPRARKMDRKEWTYLRSGLAEFDIVVNLQGYLIDGYCGYLLAKKFELTDVPVTVQTDKYLSDLTEWTGNNKRDKGRGISHKHRNINLQAI